MRDEQQTYDMVVTLGPDGNIKSVQLMGPVDLDPESELDPS